MGGLSEVATVMLDEGPEPSGPGQSGDVTDWLGFWTSPHPFQCQWHLKTWEQKAKVGDSPGLRWFLYGFFSSNLLWSTGTAEGGMRWAAHLGSGPSFPQWPRNLAKVVIPLGHGCFSCKIWLPSQFFTYISPHNPHNTLWSRCYRYFHLLNIETLGKWNNLPKSRRKWQSRDFNPGLFVLALGLHLIYLWACVQNEGKSIWNWIVKMTICRIYLKARRKDKSTWWLLTDGQFESLITEILKRNRLSASIAQQIESKRQEGQGAVKRKETWETVICWVGCLGRVVSLLEFLFPQLKNRGDNNRLFS